MPFVHHSSYVVYSNLASNVPDSRVDMEVGELSLPDVRKDSSNITNSGTSGRTILSNHIFYHKVT